MGSRLPIDGVMSAAVRSAIRDFQRKNRLPVSGYIGPDTDRRCGAWTEAPKSASWSSKQNPSRQTRIKSRYAIVTWRRMPSLRSS